MARQIRNKSSRARITELIKQPLFIPYIILLYSIITLPVIYFVSKSPQDIRQNAASIATKSMAINTDDVSYRVAVNSVIPPTTFNTIVLVLLIVSLFSVILAVLLYNRKS